MKWNAKGYLSAAFCILVWGGTFVSTDGLLRDFSALEVMLLRFGLAWVVLWALTWRRALKVKGHDEWLFAGMGLSGVVVYQLLENCAIYYTDATNVAILTSAGPIVTVIMTHLICRELIGGIRFWIGSLVAMGGVILVAMDGVVNFRLRPLGDLMVLAAMVSWAFYTVLVRIVNKKGYDPLLVIRRSFFWTLVLLLPLSIWGATESGWCFLDGSLSLVLDTNENLERFAKVGNLVGIAFLGVFASAGCFVLWNVACRELGTAKSAIGIYLIPLVAIVTGIVVNDEWPSSLRAFGALCILVGVGIVYWRRGNGR